MVPSRVTVVTYHRVDTPGNFDLADSLIDAYPPDFEAQMRYLARRYTVISSWDLVRALREDYRLPARALVITFDDGYRCFRDTALPVLRRLGLPVTLFVPTAYPGARDRAFWWDAVFRAVMRTAEPRLDVPGLGTLPLAMRAERATAYERLVTAIEHADARSAARLVDQVIERCAVPPGPGSAILDWDELAALAAEGVAIGPHTREHIILSRAAPDRVREEVAGSWADLQARIPRPLPLFCYPNGKPHAIGPAAVRAAREAGLAGACTMVAGLNVVGRTNPYLLFRVGMEAGESLRRVAFKLTGAARVYRRVKALLRPAQAGDAPA